MKLTNVRFLWASLFFCSGLAASSDDSIQVDVLAEGLDHPWGMAFISNEEILLTELSGNLRRLSNGVLNPAPIAGVPAVMYAGQGGLSEVLLDPNFAENGLLYL